MLINYTKLKDYRYRQGAIKRYCHKCGGELEYCYLERGVYSIRCEDCKYHTLIEAENPNLALVKVGEK